MSDEPTTGGPPADDPAPGEPAGEPPAGDLATGARRATIRTRHADPELIAAALAPDNTDEIETRVEEGSVVTEIVRESTGGLRSTADDYVVNLSVAERTARRADEHRRRTSERHAENTHDT